MQETRIYRLWIPKIAPMTGRIVNAFRWRTKGCYIALRDRLDRFYAGRPQRVRMAGVSDVTKLNLGCGTQKVPGYCGIDMHPAADLVLDLSRHDLPFGDDSIEAVVCMSAINYFTRPRAQELIREVHRVLQPGGVARFGVQDMKKLARCYVEGDTTFLFQKKADGSDRFEGETIGDKFVAWFYGYTTLGGACKYFYDYESLAHIFKQVGFATVERKGFLESRLADVRLMDNRPEQMFFLEAVK